jgi:MFS family permease
MAMTTPRRQSSRQHVHSLGSHVREGFSYAWKSRPLRAILGLLAAVSLVGFPYTVLLPIVVKVVIGGGPETLGFLVASTGIGAVLGGFYLASRQSIQGLVWKVPAAAALFGGGLIAFAYTDSFFLSLFIMLVEGFGMMILMAGSNTLIQNLVDDDKRGRVMSIFAMAFFGVTPFGSLAAGWLAGVIGVVGTIACAGVLTLSGTLYFGRHLPAIRRAVMRALAAQRIAAVATSEVPTGLAAPLEE